jgi:hypothetical protein
VTRGEEGQENGKRKKNRSQPAQDAQRSIKGRSRTEKLTVSIMAQ